MSENSNIEQIDNYSELREFTIDAFIKKYDNDFRIVSSKLRQALDITYFMKDMKYLTLLVDYTGESEKISDIYVSNAEDKMSVNSYAVLNNINFIEEEGTVIRCGISEFNKKSYVNIGIIYLNLNSVIRKYKIRKLV
jgi:hypothetical protein